jgi:hypothetical protein
MAKAQRFPRKVEFWTTDAQAEAIDRLDASGLLNKADHLRRAIELYLQHLDALAMSRLTTANGAHHQAAGAHNV